MALTDKQKKQLDEAQKRILAGKGVWFVISFPIA